MTSVIYDPQAKTPVGCNKDEALDRNPITLYGSYCQHARQSGVGVKSHRNFSPDLIELCNSVLGLEVKHVHTKTGNSSSVYGYGRTEMTEFLPTSSLLFSG
jgi:putative DNA primase/helicase